VKRLIQPQPANTATVPLEESAFLQAVVDAIPGAFYVIDEQGYFVRWNRAAQELVGAPDERMPRTTVLDAICGEDRPLIASLIQAALAKGYAEAEARVAHGDIGIGEMRWRFLTARRVDIAGKAYLVGTGLDVTERKKLERELEHQARTDFLTGIPNRRYFLNLADQELARARRYGRPFSMLMLDLDLFKNVNDHYGHRVGDLTLQKVVEVCGQMLREVDVVGRLGGEEFGIILPETDAEQALQVADRVRQAVAIASVALPKGGSVSITTSIGVATYSEADTDVDAVLNRADRALYQAKRSGRDRVSSEGESSVA
jgi:diguanylate cyclase (GGDEF)-like protein/PAS domain S-box-containing protein